MICKASQPSGNEGCLLGARSADAHHSNTNNHKNNRNNKNSKYDNSNHSNSNQDSCIKCNNIKIKTLAMLNRSSLESRVVGASVGWPLLLVRVILCSALAGHRVAHRSEGFGPHAVHPASLQGSVRLAKQVTPSTVSVRSGRSGGNLRDASWKDTIQKEGAHGVHKEGAQSRYHPWPQVRLSEGPRLPDLDY